MRGIRYYIAVVGAAVTLGASVAYAGNPLAKIASFPIKVLEAVVETPAKAVKNFGEAVDKKENGYWRFATVPFHTLNGVVAGGINTINRAGGATYDLSKAVWAPCARDWSDDGRSGDTITRELTINCRFAEDSEQALQDLETAIGQPVRNLFE